jgi:hypothetical protein
MRTLLSLSAAVGILVCTGLGLSGSRAATLDRVQLRVQAPSIDGSLQFASSSGWTWSCTSPVCTVNTSRGNTLTVTAISGGASSFQWWGGACAASGTQPTCTIQVNDDLVNATARFSRLRLWLPTFGPGTVSVSSPQGGAPPAGRSCGSGCVDYGTGEPLLLRGSPDAGYEPTAWGGACAGIPANHGCLLTLSHNTVVSMTFERIPPKDCASNSSCDGVTPTTTFSVRVNGTGTVTAPKQGINPLVTCSSSGTTGQRCSLDRAVDRTVSVTASGVRFRYWGGRCAGVRSTICKFTNKSYQGDAAVITAVFG